MLSYWDPSWLLNYEKSYLLFNADNVVALQTSGAEVPGSNLSTLPQCSWALYRIIVNECGKSQGNLPLIINILCVQVKCWSFCVSAWPLALCCPYPWSWPHSEQRSPQRIPQEDCFPSQIQSNALKVSIFLNLHLIIPINMFTNTITVILSNVHKKQGCGSGSGSTWIHSPDKK